MMTHVLIATLSLSTAANPDGATREEKLKYLDGHIESAAAVQRGGILLTIGGALGMAAGGALVGFGEGRAFEAAKLEGKPGTRELYLREATTLRALGITLLGVGAVAVGVGIVFWVQGAEGEHLRSEARRADAHLAPFARWGRSAD